MRRIYNARMLKARAILLLAPLVLASGCAGGWQQMKTRKITGYAERTRDFRDLMEQLELSHAALSSFFPRADVGPVEVLFLQGAELTHTFGIHRGGMAFPTVPGAAEIGRKNLLVMTTGQGMSSAAALLTHLFLHKVVPNAPLWLHQSLAQYFKRVVVQEGDGKWMACFGRVARLGGGFFRMPLDKFFAVTWQSYPVEPGYYLGTAQLLMDFIFHGDGNAHRAKLPAIFAATVQGIPGEKIMASTFPGVSFEQLGERLSGFSNSVGEQRERGLFCPLPIPIAPDRLPDESAPQESPVPAAHVEQLMAALRKLPHGDNFPSWYPLEVLGLGSDSKPAAAP